jgi:hypothetical protein
MKYPWADKEPPAICAIAGMAETAKKSGHVRYVAVEA